MASSGFTTPFKQTDSIPATAFYYSLRSGSVYPCAVAAALVEKTKHRGGTGKRPVPAMPHQATTGVASSLCFTPKAFFFFFLVPFVAKTFLPPAPFKNPSPTLSSFPFLSLSRLFHLTSLPTPSYFTFQTHRKEPLIRSLPLSLLFSKPLPSHLIKDVCK